MNRIAITLAGVACLVAGISAAQARDAKMSFFITSQGPGDGANLGGLAGADAHCRKLANAVGAGGKTWRAYLGTGAANARDRPGGGPWHNAKGEMIADNLAAPHGAANRINRAVGLNEKGGPVDGRGDSPNMHDIMTGSNPDGTVVAGKSRGDWTTSGAGNTIVGHHDRGGLRDDAPWKSWNSSHQTRGCDQGAPRRAGGNALFYCFAAALRP